MNYASSVIPIILAVLVTAKVEKIFLSFIPTIFKSFDVPFCTMLVMIPLTILIVGPVSTWLGQAVGAAISVLLLQDCLLAISDFCNVGLALGTCSGCA